MCLKKRLQAIVDGQVEGNSAQQYLELHRAIADEGGQPHKGTKSTARDFLEARYPTITTSSLPTGWNPDCVLFDVLATCTTKKGLYIGAACLDSVSDKTFLLHSETHGGNTLGI